MATKHRKGSGYNNISETWDRNEQRLGDHSSEENSVAPISRDLQQTIKEEAAEYDEANKDERILSGDRASRNEAEE